MQTPVERRTELATRHPTWVGRTIAQQFDAASAEFPDRPFLITDETTWTYRQMQAWSRRIAAGLIAAGVEAGDHVALLLGNYPEYAAIKYAISRVGAVAVPINYNLRTQELKYILDQSDSRMLILMSGSSTRDYQHDLDEIAPDWVRVGGGAALPQLRKVCIVPTHGDVRDGAFDLAKLVVAGESVNSETLESREAAGNPQFRSDVIYTSGTTGLPKGVMLTHDMILRAAYASAYTRAFEDGRRILFALPMYHVFGYVECMIAVTFVGGSIVPHVTFDANRMIKAAQQHQVTEMVCVPLMTLKMLDVARNEGFDSRHLIAVFNSGGISPPSIWQDIRTVLGAEDVLTGYGMTETTASTTCTMPEDPEQRLLASNGRFKPAGVAGDPALGGFAAVYKVVDPVTGEELPPGVPGELMAKGLIVTDGYYKKPDETRATLEADGWLHTGDVGVIDADGYLSLTGRIKETYRCGGEMVMPKEIEDLLIEQPGVSQVLVVGIPDTKMGDVGCICVVPSNDVKPDPQALIDLCANGLARFKVPKHVVYLEASDIPLTATGKAQKFRLVELVKKRIAAGQCYTATPPKASRQVNSN